MNPKKGRIRFSEKCIRPFCFFILFLFLTVPALSALEVPKRPQGYVNDWADLLSPPARAKIEDQLRAFEETTSNQVVVVTLPSLQGDSLEDFSIRLAEAWKIGQKGKDNGVIFLIFRDDRKMRIEVGYGLEGVLPDIVAGRIIREIVAPYFRKGDFPRGINAGVDAIIQAIKGEFEGVMVDETWHLILKGLLWLLVWMILRILVERYEIYEINKRGGQLGVPYTGGGGGWFGGGFSGGGGGFGGGGASGGW